MKTNVDKAIAVIRGYCDKIVACGHCRYVDDGQLCPFMKKVPCDWDMDKGTEAEKGVVEK